MAIKVVTSFSDEGYKLYGKKMLQSFVKHWPGEIHVYHEGGKHPDFTHKKIKYHSLLQVPGCADFLRITSMFPVLRGEIIAGKRDYRFDIFRFARKMFAQIDAAVGHDDLLLWLDADTETYADIDEEWIRAMFQGAFMVYMGRPDWHSCASFVGWDCAHEESHRWWTNEYDMLISGKFMLVDEFHDSFLLDVLRQALDVRAVNLSAQVTDNGPVNVFDIVFAGKARHFKGNKKFGPKRYAQLINIVAEEKPNLVIEVGTWNGERALEMAAASPGMRYIGLDLFEHANPTTDAEEKNVKPHHTVQAIYEKLNHQIAKVILVPGNTRETFPILVETMPEKADLIYIDGGHSVETIQSDWDNALKVLKPGGVIVLDDYYVDMPEKYLDMFGCNRILEKSGMEYEVLPIVDPVVGGGGTKMAVVRMPL